MLILGIETSCDETGLALFDTERGLLAHTLHSQIALHAAFGGVVPELASRDHIKRLIPLLELLLQKTNRQLTDINGIAYAKAPGLVGALLVGAAFAKSLAFALNIPALGVHHLEAHFLAPMLKDPKPAFPFLALLVSGGHTMLVQVAALGDYTILGETLDDAAGEAFDKVGKILGLPYPGGPHLAKLAEQGNTKRFRFPRPMVNRPGLEFSFSGLKTFALNCLEKNGNDDQTRADIAAAFQDAVVDTLRIKCRRALQETNLSQLVVAGGVSANLMLRVVLTKMVHEQNSTVFFPPFEFCTDNGAMIAYLGAEKFLRGAQDDLAIKVFARLPI